MIEKKRIPANVQIEFPAAELPYVIVKDINDCDTLPKFMESCQKVLSTGQNFLPIIIDSYGGSVYTAFGMMDFLDSLDVDIITVCQSKAMSAGGLLFTMGKDRYASPLATFMIHEVWSIVFGKDTDIQNDAKETSRLNKKIFEILDKNTGQKSGYWKALCKENDNADLYLNTKQAKKHGMVTDLQIPHVETSVIIERKLVV